MEETVLIYNCYAIKSISEISEMVSAAELITDATGLEIIYRA